MFWEEFALFFKLVVKDPFKKSALHTVIMIVSNGPNYGALTRTFLGYELIK